MKRKKGAWEWTLLSLDIPGEHLMTFLTGSIFSLHIS
jgi:hypothetical protein